ncbi:sensor histidine kinase [Vibrio gallicus]|uniref:sensor histidine kinase n=1 Tax=Vibrio gallicus TaxID=190897 RepID=UPI0021C47E32|nr:HAMP domain-containing sensor histidine kinase [Vibrio gallicus]
MRVSLRCQLIATYLLVSLLTATTTYFITYFTSEQRVNELTLTYQTKEMKQEVIAWYQSEQSWEGFSDYFAILHPNYGPDRPRMQVHPDPRQNLRYPKRHGIVTSENHALVPFLTFLEGDYVSSAFLSNAQPIYVHNQLVAWIILPEATGLSLESQLDVFLGNLHETLFVAVVIGMFASLILGLILSRWLLKPMDLLHNAMSSMSQGRLLQKVPITANNELGELAKGFNSMSSSISQADQKRRQLTADVTHDLSSPLQVISGYLEMAQQGDIHLDSARLEIMASEVDRMDRLIKDMNLLAKTDSQSLELELASVPVTEFMQDARKRFDANCRAVNISLHLELNSQLPSVYIDEGRMLQVMGNLINNALRYTPEFGVIGLSARRAGERCEIEVSDNGCGIDPAILENIFERFYKVEVARSGYDGQSGLGLSIVKGLLEVQGGTIYADSDGVKGARFVISLPILV